jgi:hypothetical protein
MKAVAGHSVIMDGIRRVPVNKNEKVLRAIKL